MFDNNRQGRSKEKGINKKEQWLKSTTKDMPEQL